MSESTRTVVEAIESLDHVEADEAHEATTDTVDESSSPSSDELTTDTTTEDSITTDAVTASTTVGGVDTPVYGSARDDIAPTDRESNSADDIDVRGLFHDPTVDLLRWLYRQNAEAEIVVDKPVKDAFKFGFEFDDTSEADQNNAANAEEWFNSEYITYLKDAFIKSRRDGVALVMWVLNDEASSAAEPVQNPQGIEAYNLLTLEDLVNPFGRHGNDVHDRDYVTADKAAENTDYDVEQLEITRSGLVVVEDITSPDHDEFVGAMYSRADEITTKDSYEFIHRDRLQHFVARPQVDGDLGLETFGHLEGDSVLTPIYHALLGITKAEWALGQSLLRYTAPLHVVEIEDHVQPKDGDLEDHLEKLNDQLGTLTNKSNVTLPPHHTMKTVGDDGSIDPEPFLDGLINQVCTGSEITRSVLQGTQSGTVSGSSTDIKNYYNQVDRLRENDITEKIHEAVRMAARFDPETVPNFATSFVVDWDDLFKVDEVERVEAMRMLVSGIGTGVSNYLLTPDEARDVLQEQWASLEADVDLEELTETDYDQLDRVNTSYGKQYKQGNRPEQELPNEGRAEGQSPRSGQNAGGSEQGELEGPRGDEDEQ